MAKIKISFNGKTYAIDKSDLANASGDLKAHLSTAMSGEGAAITLDGASYSVDAEKLSARRDELVSHILTNIGASDDEDIAGYVKLGNFDYSISKAKTSGILTALSSTFNALIGLVPGLYQTGAVAAYRANGPEAIKDMLITSFDDLLADGIFTQGATSTMLSKGTNAQSVLVGDFVFPSMSHLASFGFTSAGIGTLSGCTGLTGLIFPDDIGNIPWNMCTSCTSLTDVIIPYGITTIYDSAFSYCSGLTSITIPDSVTYISGTAFSHCTGLTEIVIPDSVKAIGMSTFNGCTALTSVVIGDSVTSIDQYAFSGCSALKEVYLPALPPALTANATFGDSSTVFYVPTAASKADYEVATNWSIYKGRFEVKQYKED